MSIAPNLEFWSATGTVTGSKYLLKTGKKSLLIDCGGGGVAAYEIHFWELPCYEPADRIDAKTRN